MGVTIEAYVIEPFRPVRGQAEETGHALLYLYSHLIILLKKTISPHPSIFSVRMIYTLILFTILEL